MLNISVIYNKPTFYILTNRENLKLFPLSFGIREGYTVSSYLINTVLEILAIVIRQGKEI
jgi:hypothetical protein